MKITNSKIQCLYFTYFTRKHVLDFQLLRSNCLFFCMIFFSLCFFVVVFFLYSLQQNYLATFLAVSGDTGIHGRFLYLMYG